MRRALFIALLALLISDASGINSLIVPESCSIGASEAAPDGGCPAFCVRCTCGCCASSVLSTTPMSLMTALLPPLAIPLPSLDRLPSGISADILHVPKPLLT
jgi:hypothetical protein